MTMNTPQTIGEAVNTPLHGTSTRNAAGGSNSSDTGRIEGLDGLRAIAVLSVLAYHFWPSAIPGGFLGVDVFFVISGFLITTILMREWNAAGRVFLLDFWVRRARRLLPALVLVVVTSVAAAWVVSDDLLVNIQRQVIGALTFSTNWVEIVAGSDYFADSSRSLFVTFWSLAVEEQFYVFWPAILVALVALTTSRAWRVFGALGLAAGSALLMAVTFDSQGSATRVYYGTDTHSFGLMIGVALAFAFAGRRLAERWQRLRPWIGFGALAGLLVLFAFVDSAASYTYRGGIFLASVLSAGAVAALPGDMTIFNRLCRISPLAWIGERSYGIYLWHWPALLIVGTALSATPDSGRPEWETAVIVTCVTFVLSAASFRWIEAPIRRVGFRETWASVSEAFRPRRGLLYWPAAALAAVIFAAAGMGFVTAPEKSRAQLSVESGEQAILAQNIQGPGAPAADSSINAGNASPGEMEKKEPGSAWPRDLRIPPGNQIVGLGDSVMSGAAPALYARFPGIYLNAKPILQWHDAPGMIQQMIDKGTIRNVVVLNFGTNAGFKEPQSERALRDILTMLGPKHRVVLVNSVGVSYWVPSTNATLLAISDQYPNTIVADWYSAVHERPDLLHRDRTHPNEAGSAVYADVVADALSHLGPG
jgi:peptidoglycan/LPS O-acetylase OafA/YrhL